jgi:hypothetical protein
MGVVSGGEPERGSGLLSLLLERLAVAAGSSEGVGDEPGTAA